MSKEAATVTFCIYEEQVRAIKSRRSFHLRHFARIAPSAISAAGYQEDNWVEREVLSRLIFDI